MPDMEDVLVNSETMTEIADAIREKTGKTDLMYPRDMPDEIASIDISEAVKADAEWFLRTLKQAYIPDGITDIREYKYYEYGDLSDIRLPETLTSIETNAFYRCKSLLLTELPDGISIIRTWAFNGCEKISLKRLPKSLSKLYPGAFMRCTNLAITRIPAACTSMDSYVTPIFGYCTSLKEITFESRLEYFRDQYSGGIFAGCINLRTINVPWAEEEIAGAPWGAVNASINYNYVEGVVDG